MKIVIALGGNALGNTPQEQLQRAAHSAVAIVDLVEAGHQVIVSHGNGPQVGMINKVFEDGGEGAPHMPFAECTALSQGYIGFHLQNTLRQELDRRGINRPVVSLVTQVVVDPEDPAFKRPEKPVGAFYTREQADAIAKERGYVFVEDAGRGYRRVVASPKPQEIVESEVIASLSDTGCIVIAGGGGGIPVCRQGHKLVGVDAVVDKDFATSKLASSLDADYLIILTAVEQVAINFGTENEQWLAKMDIATVERYVAEGHFAPGSMLPKVEAAKAFALSDKGRKALITSLDKAAPGIRGETGTLIEDISLV